MPKLRLIVLLHGYKRQSHDMDFLAKNLKNIGAEIFCPNLPTSYSSLEKIIQNLAEKFNAMDLKKYDSIDFIAHSMGGLIASDFINLLKLTEQAKVKNLICIATPFKGSKLADIICCIPFFATIYKPIKSLTTKRKVSILQNKNIQVHLIVATKTKGFLGFFLDKENDELVDLKSELAYKNPASVHRVANDYWIIHKQPTTLKIIQNILIKGN